MGIDHPTQIHGPCLGVEFDRYERIREYFIDSGEEQKAEAIENIIKNDVGIRRLIQEKLICLKLTKGRPQDFMRGNL